MSRSLADVRLTALMLDGIELKGRGCVVCLGVTTDGVKVPLGLWDGSTENKRVCVELLADLLDRGLDCEQGVLSSWTAARRCGPPSTRSSGRSRSNAGCVTGNGNVVDHLPERDRPAVKRRLRAAWKLSDHRAGMLEAERQFRKIIGYQHLAALAVAVENDLAAARAATSRSTTPPTNPTTTMATLPPEAATHGAASSSPDGPPPRLLPKLASCRRILHDAHETVSLLKASIRATVPELARVYTDIEPLARTDWTTQPGEDEVAEASPSRSWANSRCGSRTAGPGSPRPTCATSGPSSPT